ncbi:unnamed protein product [Toxocara canis]|uniref:G-patch domain-containing protein n=1 Tax=Toxocara canis TaxID=6265 RepID=A0A183UHG1_TOXCA|nr:unnamed protein product [Toxocara canis]
MSRGLQEFKMMEEGELAEEPNTSSIQALEAADRKSESEIGQKSSEKSDLIVSRASVIDEPTTSASILDSLAPTSAGVNEVGGENTSLFYYPPTRCYYYYDEQTASYVFHSRIPAQQVWNVRGAKKHAVSVFGESFTQGMLQEEVDAFECIHQLIRSCRDLDEGEIDSDEPSEAGSDVEKWSDDEIQQMMLQERMEHAPCIRLIDSLTAQLSVITIAGATIGASSRCDVQLSSEDMFPMECAKVHYEDAENLYMVSSMQDECQVIVNDIPLGVQERRIVEHGDVWKIGGHTLIAHLHHGDNTCSGCEPGLLTSSGKYTENVRIVPMRSSESLRRRNVRLMKAQYGLLGDDMSKHQLPIGHSGAAPQKRNQLSRPPSGIVNNHASIYSHCEAKPRPGSSVESVVLHSTPTVAEKAIDETNKGYKLLCGMGWKEGTGLGRTLSGIKEPVVSEKRIGRAGLGSNQGKQSKKVEPPAKLRILEITKERFNQVQEMTFEDAFCDHSLK